MYNNMSIEESIIPCHRECWGPVHGKNGHSVQIFGDITFLSNRLRGFAWCEGDGEEHSLIRRSNQHIPLFFYVDKNNEDLAGQFQGMGYEVPEMVRSTKNLENLNLSETITIKRVTPGDAGKTRTWCSIVAGTSRDSFVQVQEFVGPLAPLDNFYFFIGYWGTTPVATSLLVLGEKPFGALYFVHTHEYFRKRGLGLAVSQIALEQAGQAGYDEVILTSTPMARSLYPKLGFKTRRTFLEFYLPPAPTSTR